MLEIYSQEKNVNPNFLENTQAPHVKYEVDDNTETENIKAAEAYDTTEAADEYPYNMLSESLW